MDRAPPRNLRTAVAVGVLLAAAFLGSLAWHPAAFTAIVAVLYVLAVVEAARVLRSAGLDVAGPVVVVAGLVMVLGAYRAGAAGQILGVLVLLGGLVGRQLVDTARSDVVAGMGPSLLLGLWVGLLASFAPLLIVSEAGGPLAVLATVAVAVLTDIGALVAGSTLGRHRMAPVLSPNKTWEGLAGGVGLAVVSGVAVLPRLGDGYDLVAAGLLALLVALAAVAGDLLESMIKRDAGVKDLGHFLPGHGGILDRMDGVLVALPVGYYATRLLA